MGVAYVYIYSMRYFLNVSRDYLLFEYQERTDIPSASHERNALAKIAISAMSLRCPAFPCPTMGLFLTTATSAALSLRARARFQKLKLPRVNQAFEKVLGQSWRTIVPLYVRKRLQRKLAECAVSLPNTLRPSGGPIFETSPF